MSDLDLDVIETWLRQRADGLYGGEAVTQLQHALQCATLAQQAQSQPELVTAALLHDIGHLADAADDVRQPHEQLAAQLLAPLFGAAVTEPIRLHVDAKRYLCASNADYWSGLSPASKRSLEWQGGPFSTHQAAAFISQAFAPDAVHLRQWDDAAKVVDGATPDLDSFVTIMRSVAKAHA